MSTTSRPNPGLPLDLSWVREIRINRSAVERRAATLVTRRTVKNQWQVAWLLRAITLMDLTTLQGDDTAARVRRLCAKARAPVRRDLLEGLGADTLPIKVAAVCVYHAFVETAVDALAGSGIPVAAVSTGFPAGLSPFSTRVDEIKASVAALRKFPDFNASLDGDNLVLKKYFNIGFAADTPNGLVVPVIKNADQKGVLQIAKEMGELSAKAREGKLGPADMQGGCFSISSLGGIGGTAFTPIINAPEVAILGVSKSATKPVWNGKDFAPRLMVPLSLSYDHRVIDGASAARFTAYLAGLLADMRRVML